MSDIRFNRWLHQSGTGGVSQSDGGHVGIGTTNPLIPVGAGNTHILNVGVVTCNNIAAGSSITAGTFYGSGANLSSLNVTAIKSGGSVKAQANADGVFVTGILTATNFKTGVSNLHNLGLTLSSGQLDIGSNIKAGSAGVITATSFSGSGANLTGIPAGLGTALSSTQTSPLNKLYYTDRVLSIGSTVTIDHPASATGAYTQYADILVEDNADLIVADGDDLIPDILGLGGNGTTGAGGAGRLLVDNIVNRSGTGAPSFPNGAVVTGVVTATSFVGSGANLTNIPQPALMADTWRLVTQYINAQGTLGSGGSDWERDDTYGNGLLGTGAASAGMSVSNGYFSFPTTGFYSVRFYGHHSMSYTNGRAISGYIVYTANNFSSSEYASYYTVNCTGDTGAIIHGSSSCEKIFDITDVSNQKFKLAVTYAQNGSAGRTTVDTNANRTYVIITRLGDT